MTLQELMLSPNQTGVHACPTLLRASERVWVVGKDSTALTAGAGRGQATVLTRPGLPMRFRGGV